VRVTVYEVGPRDGLQSLSDFVPSEKKRELIRCLYDAGLVHVEEVSFAHPKLVPQMADAEEVFSGRGSALVMNRRGFERALKVGVEKINIVLSPCEHFSMKNMGKTRSEKVHELWTFLNGYPKENVRVYVSMAFGSPYSGVFSEGTIRSVVRDAAMFGNTVVFADTVGVGTEKDVVLFAQLAREAGVEPALHLHHRGDVAKPLRLVRAGIFAGISQFDSSIGGLGGCPFAEKSGANLATEVLVHHLRAWGANTGVGNLDAALSVVNDIRADTHKDGEAIVAIA